MIMIDSFMLLGCEEIGPVVILGTAKLLLFRSNRKLKSTLQQLGFLTPGRNTLSQFVLQPENLYSSKSDIGSSMSRLKSTRRLLVVLSIERAPSRV